MSMFGDLNEVRILGNLTGDPELRFTPGGTAVLNFSVATNRRYKKGDDWQEEVTYHNIVVWGQNGQTLSTRVKKGTRVMVLGRINVNSWEGNDGRKNYKTEIVADDVMLIDRFNTGPQSELSEPNPVSSSSNTQGSGSTGSNDNIANDAEINPDDLPF